MKQFFKKSKRTAAIIPLIFALHSPMYESCLSFKKEEKVKDIQLMKNSLPVIDKDNVANMIEKIKNIKFKDLNEFLNKLPGS